MFLVCFFVDGDEYNVHLVSQCVKSIVDNTSIGVEFVALCDENYAKNMMGVTGVRVITTPCNAKPLEAAKRKSQIFDLIPDILNFEAVMVMEPASRVCGDIAKIFKTCTTTKLYVYQEPSRDGLQSLMYGLQKYTVDELMSAYFHGAHGFNTRHFMFKPTLSLKDHFDKVTQLIMDHDTSAPSYKEQSFFNHYFITRAPRFIDRQALICFVHQIDPSSRFSPKNPFLVTPSSRDAPSELKAKVLDEYFGSKLIHNDDQLDALTQKAKEMGKPVEEVLFR